MTITGTVALPARKPGRTVSHLYTEGIQPIRLWMTGTTMVWCANDEE